MTFYFPERNQSTIPAELPIVGDPYTEISLNLIFPKGNPLFTLKGKRLELIAPLDRDAENLSHIVFQVSEPLFAVKSAEVYQMFCVLACGHISIDVVCYVWTNTTGHRRVGRLKPIWQ